MHQTRRRPNLRRLDLSQPFQLLRRQFGGQAFLAAEGGEFVGGDGEGLGELVFHICSSATDK